MRFFTLLLVFLLLAPAHQAHANKTPGIIGNFSCNNVGMVEMNSGRETPVAGRDITGIRLNSSSGMITHPKGGQDLVTFGSEQSVPETTSYTYNFKNNEAFESIEMRIDNQPNPQRQSVLITTLVPVAGMNIKVLGFGRY